MRGRQRRLRPIVIAVAALILSGSALAVVAAGGGGEGGKRGQDPTADLEFAGAVKLSLSPLISHAVALRNQLRDLATAQTAPPPAVIENFRRWSEEFATARDLVGRLVPPRGLVFARETAVLGTMFYRESAVSVSSLPATNDLLPLRTAASRALRLRLIGDRLFDASRRALSPDRFGVTHLVAGLPDPVPDFRQEGLEPEQDGASTVAAIPSMPPEPLAPVPEQAWAEQHSEKLRPAARAVSAVITRGSGVAISTLENLAAEMGGPLPAGAQAAEGTVLVRLSLLTAAEALRASSPPGPAEVEGQQRLRLLTLELWELGRQRLERADIATPGEMDVAAGTLDAGLLRSGGTFGGNPPRLNAGDPPDLGVPGGLRLPDPAVLLQQ